MLRKSLRRNRGADRRSLQEREPVSRVAFRSARPANRKTETLGNIGRAFGVDLGGVRQKDGNLFNGGGKEAGAGLFRRQMGNYRPTLVSSHEVCDFERDGLRMSCCHLFCRNGPEQTQLALTQCRPQRPCALVPARSYPCCQRSALRPVCRSGRRLWQTRNVYLPPRRAAAAFRIGRPAFMLASRSGTLS